MSVSIIAGLLIVWQVLAGFARGAIRSVANLTGVAGALLLSTMFAGAFQPIIASYITQNPVWERSLAVCAAGFVIWLVCVIAGRIIQYAVCGPQSAFWSFGLNKKLGLFIGFIEGLVLAFVFLWVVYFLGTTAWLFQPVAETKARPMASEGTLAAFLINAKSDLVASPVGGLITGLDPTPPRAYDAMKLLGVLADQPEKRERLAEYPPFERMVRLKPLHDALNDPELQKLIRDQRSGMNLAMHPKVQALLQDKQTREALVNFDWTDALKFVNGPAPRRR